VRLSEVIGPLRRREYLYLAGIPRIRASTESAKIGSRSSASILTISVRPRRCHTSIASAGGRRARRRRPIGPGAGCLEVAGLPELSRSRSQLVWCSARRRLSARPMAHEPGDDARAAADRHRATDHMTA
jgi:hypothetical protein